MNNKNVVLTMNEVICLYMFQINASRAGAWLCQDPERILPVNFWVTKKSARQLNLFLPLSIQFCFTVDWCNDVSWD